MRATASRSVNIANLALSRIGGLTVPLPPLPEQERLVDKIERLLAQSRTAREALDHIPPILKRFRQAVLAQAFRGELTERDPNDEPASVLLERVREERRRKWEEDLRARGKDPRRAKYVEPEEPDTKRLPQLPEGWAWANVRGVAAAIQYGYTSKSGEANVGPRYLRITDIQEDKVDWDAVPFCRITEEDERKYRLETGDILFVRSGATAGKSFLIADAPRAVFASYLIRLRLPPEILPRYLYLYFHSKSYWDQVVFRGNAQPNANAQVLRGILFPVAPVREQHSITDKLDVLFAETEAVEWAATTGLRMADRVDQAVLARAFRGEL